MTRIRIYSHTIQDAPEASRPLLEGVVQFSPTGKLLNLHAQMDLPAAPGERGMN